MMPIWYTVFFIGLTSVAMFIVGCAAGYAKAKKNLKKYGGL